MLAFEKTLRDRLRSSGCYLRVVGYVVSFQRYTKSRPPTFEVIGHYTLGEGMWHPDGKDQPAVACVDLIGAVAEFEKAVAARPAPESV